MPDRVAFVLDGGFVKKKLYERNRHFPTAAEIVALVATTMGKPRLVGLELFRVYYYDAPPYEGHVTNPLSRVRTNLAISPSNRANKALLDALELEPDFAVRRGELIHTGWELGRAALFQLTRPSQNPPRAITANDLVPALEQKGVDTRIGLDLAMIALKHTVQVLVLVTGDSDFVPVMKFVRTEGVRVYLERLGHPVRRDLRAHADFVF